MRTAGLAESEYNRGWEEASERISHDINAELVCCDVYARRHTATLNERKSHDLCYWGGAAAKISEEVGKRLR